MSTPRFGTWFDTVQRKNHYVDLITRLYLPDHKESKEHKYVTINPGDRDPAYKVTENFSVHELVCKCGCGYFFFNDHFLYTALQPFRTKIGRPLSIRSGCRCPEHNTASGGSPTSDHLSLFGVDIVTNNGLERFEIITNIIPFFDRLGVANSFIHVGSSSQRPNVGSQVQWKY